MRFFGGSHEIGRHTDTPRQEDTKPFWHRDVTPEQPGTFPHRLSSDQVTALRTSMHDRLTATTQQGWDELAERLSQRTGDGPTHPAQGQDTNWRGTCGPMSVREMVNHHTGLQLTESDMVQIADKSGLARNGEQFLLAAIRKHTILIDDDAADLLVKHAHQLTTTDLAGMPHFQELAGHSPKEAVACREVLLKRSEAASMFEHTPLDPALSQKVKALLDEGNNNSITRADVETMIEQQTLTGALKARLSLSIARHNSKLPDKAAAEIGHLVAPVLASRPDIFVGSSELGGTLPSEQLKLASQHGLPLIHIAQESEPGGRHSGVWSENLQGEKVELPEKVMTLEMLESAVKTHEKVILHITGARLNPTELPIDPLTGKLFDVHRPGGSKDGVADHAIIVDGVRKNAEGELEFRVLDSRDLPLTQLVGTESYIPVYNKQAAATHEWVSGEALRAAWLNAKSIGMSTTTFRPIVMSGSMIVPDQPS
ncbi:MAG: hypothetical protein J2P37_34040 [Ktedonobacteraceae bacterium]|nr:hypothetical protein [Ktedonobacteraceae bacterium]MBO0793780.1 hypothetical protein [Ktedonobacteraceae bacterium]